MKRPTSMRVQLAAKEIGEHINVWRRIHNLTTQQLAEKANTSRSTISRLEHGDPSVSFETVLEVCNQLGVLDRLKTAVDPFEDDYGRIRAELMLPKRIRS